MTTSTLSERLYFTGDSEADRLLVSEPLALLIGFALDQQITVQKAFSGPLELKRRIGALDAATIAAMDATKLDEVFRRPPALHRFPGSMAGKVQALAAAIARDYGNDAGRVWTEASDGHDLERRLLGLPGSMAGKVQALATAIARDYGNDAGRVWTEATDGKDLERRLLGLPGFGPMKAKALIEIVGLRLGVQPPGWEAVRPTHPTLGGVDSPEALARYQEGKRAYKASLKAKGS